jgi:hypothetical protein
MRQRGLLRARRVHPVAEDATVFDPLAGRRLGPRDAVLIPVGARRIRRPGTREVAATPRAEPR